MLGRLPVAPDVHEIRPSSETAPVLEDQLNCALYVLASAGAVREERYRGSGANSRKMESPWDNNENAREPLSMTQIRLGKERYHSCVSGYLA